MATKKAAGRKRTKAAPKTGNAPGCSLPLGFARTAGTSRNVPVNWN
jgi:hypothetical protein